MDKAAKKLGEEAVETVIAAVEGDRAALVAESADLLYHLAGRAGVAGVAAGGRHGANSSAAPAQSGLAEKAARPG